MWLPDRGVIIEQKSSGVDIDKPELRQGTEVTPYQQALRYAMQMPLSQQPRYVVDVNDGARPRLRRGTLTSLKMRQICLGHAASSRTENILQFLQYRRGDESIYRWVSSIMA